MCMVETQNEEQDMVHVLSDFITYWGRQTWKQIITTQCRKCYLKNYVPKKTKTNTKNYVPRGQKKIVGPSPGVLGRISSM